MKKILNKQRLETGQVLPLVVLMMFVIIGMVALILDGGAIMSNRRTAQAAADAGALAGAQRICVGKTDAVTVAQDYATVQNDATSAVVSVAGQEVTVNATVQRSSFFARIFGEENLTATADATAGCFFPSVAQRVLPISFFYKSPPINAKDAVCDTDGSCNLVNWVFDELMTALDTTDAVTPNSDPGVDGVINLPLDDIYVISNNTKVCEKSVTGAIVCSEMEGHESGGNRSFLDLNDVLSKIIESGLDDPISLPAWVNGEAGAVSAVYKASNFITNYDPIKGYPDLEARLYFLPVYDLYCPDCSCAPTEDYDPIYCDQANKPAYHLLGIAPFVVTCVQQGPKCEYGNCVPTGTWTLGEVTVDVSKEICPGLLATNPSDPPYENAIEGYFVDGFPVDQFVWGTDGVDVGAYLISLSE